MTMTAEAPTAAEVEKRLRSNSKKVQEFAAKAEASRAERDAALVSLHVHEGWTPVQCYRLVDVSRGLFVRMMAKAEEQAEQSGDEIPHVPDAEKTAKRAARELARHDAALDQYRDKRDDDAVPMLNGAIRKDDGGMYRNAEVARMTGLTTARVAQLRHGER
jgi:hypothetical protein